MIINFYNATSSYQVVIETCEIHLERFLNIQDEVEIRKELEIIKN